MMSDIARVANERAVRRDSRGADLPPAAVASIDFGPPRGLREGGSSGSSAGHYPPPPRPPNAALVRSSLVAGGVALPETDRKEVSDDDMYSSSEFYSTDHESKSWSGEEPERIAS